MQAVDEVLEKLLGDIRKTISDNSLFLKALLNEADVGGSEEEKQEEEEFEEL